MTIADVLQEKGHRVVRVRETDSVRAAVGKLAEHRIGAVVVEDAWMKPAGIFSERDFLNAVATRGAAVLDLPVGALMSHSLISCRSKDRVDDAMAAMTQARIRHLPVIDGGDLVGIVSIGDLVKHRLDEKALEANVLLDLARMRA
ncbi:MAG: CBS domain-containing protein [Rhodospirillales bacterium]|nr:CBS domain-containing protein [Rhodospirillales bacterium]MBN8901638.1 CBS domain-containing protein [Rhodospirillales bacterium]